MEQTHLTTTTNINAKLIRLPSTEFIQRMTAGSLPPARSTQQELMAEFLTKLSHKERCAYEIAKSHLGSSFQLEKSNAFLKWKNKNNA